MTGGNRVRAGGVEAPQVRSSLPPNPLNRPAISSGPERAVWGALAAGVGTLAFGRRHGPLARVALLALGGGLVTLAATGRNPLYDALKLRQNDAGEILVREAVTVGRPPHEVYARWRDLSRLPDFMEMLERIEVLHGTRSRWTVRGPAGPLTFEAELTADEPGQRIAWRTVPGPGVQHHGEVTFRPAPGDRGTEVLARYGYAPPGGPAGAAIARILNHEPGQRTRDDLMRLKRIMELGFIPTAKGQTSGRGVRAGKV
ncbi:SRPBCC family protein [Deinococcus aquiradiocola]|uniref:Cyclase n=1 Tax=Deinococcus aquiradiocola TaxID=393059 RepID=A0A917P8C4_9DEIO|nr:SRPBCC family protein [Deinococcus aquiradiocola]GGJ66556.1 cyclase [Deinococcus aquiradiocola]